MGKTGPPGFVGPKGSRGTIGHVVKWNSNDLNIYHSFSYTSHVYTVSCSKLHHV